VSFSGTYGDGALNLMVGWEKNAIKSELSNLGATYDFGSVKLFATLAQSKPVVGAKSSAWVVGTRYSLGASTFIAGYGHRKPDGSGMNDQISLGYQYALSKRTFVYTDAFRSRFPSVSNARVLDVGVHHSF
jgi:predicted porin